MAFDKGRERSESLTQADILLQIAQTLQQVQENSNQGSQVGEALKHITDTLAGVATRTRPENPESPGISGYSYPEGDLKHPKPDLKCPMFWVGYPEEKESLTPLEIELLNQIEPGEYVVTKANGNQIPFRVEGKKNLAGKLESLSFSFPCKGDQSTDHGSKVSYLRQALGMKVPSIEELQAELARMQADLATAHAVINAA